MRRQARELAFKLIFERLFVKNSYTFDEEFFSTLKDEEDIEFSKKLVETFTDNRQALEDLISKHLHGYELKRLYKIDLALMLLALTEIIYIGTPFQIVINEVVEIAKSYSTDKSSRFINGVLSSIIKELNLLQEGK